MRRTRLGYQLALAVVVGGVHTAEQSWQVRNRPKCSSISGQREEVLIDMDQYLEADLDEDAAPLIRGNF